MSREWQDRSFYSTQERYESGKLMMWFARITNKLTITRCFIGLGYSSVIIDLLLFFFFPLFDFFLISYMGFASTRAMMAMIVALPLIVPVSTLDLSVNQTELEIVRQSHPVGLEQRSGINKQSKGAISRRPLL